METVDELEYKAELTHKDIEIYELKEQIKKLNRSIELREACIDVYKNIVNNLYKLLDIDIKEREEESLVDKEIKK